MTTITFEEVTVCDGGEHYHVPVVVDDGKETRKMNVQLDASFMKEPLSDEDIEAYVKTSIKIMKSQTEESMKEVIQRKTIDLGVSAVAEEVVR